MSSNLSEQVKEFWEKIPCGTDPFITQGLEKGSPAWFKRIEDYRYAIEPFIPALVPFSEYKDKKVLEVGVGAGTDHLQWARAGADCYGVDLTDAAIETTRRHLACYGLSSKLQRTNAEKLAFANNTFDAVYSWGVIHHAEEPQRIINEIHRILKEGGDFIGMFYGRHSILAYKLWLRYALACGKPWRSLNNVIWHHMESIGTKAYTVSELKDMFAKFRHVVAHPQLTAYDTHRIPPFIAKALPNRLGWFIIIKAKK